MDRKEAEALVAGVTIRIGNFSAVLDDEARRILGDETFAKLKADPVRRHGPNAFSVYPWNVVDYLQMYGI